MSPLCSRKREKEKKSIICCVSFLLFLGARDMRPKCRRDNRDQCLVQGKKGETRKRSGSRWVVFWRCSHAFRTKKIGKKRIPHRQDTETTGTLQSLNSQRRQKRQVADLLLGRTLSDGQKNMLCALCDAFRLGWAACISTRTVCSRHAKKRPCPFPDGNKFTMCVKRIANKWFFHFEV